MIVGGKVPFLVLPVSMDWIDMHTDSTLWTGDQPLPEERRSRQMTPLEYTCGCMGISSYAEC